MNGIIIPNTPIAVDFWMIRQASNAKLFFLSHAHADHTAGLSSSWNEPIYCSEITGRIIRHKYNIKKELIRTLEVGESRIIELDVIGQETMTVSVIEANHCAGAVMFLFEGYFGSILYTGDFRYSPAMFTDSVLSQKRIIDTLYLDNTYCDPKCVFPSQADAIQSAVDLIKSHPEHEVVIGTTDIGKEELLIQLATKLQMAINVSNERFELYKLLELPNVFTTDPMVADIRVVPRKQLKIQNLVDWASDKELPTIILIPTCLFVGLEKNIYNNIENVFVVPFSDHSSYEELRTFVEKVRPRQVIPIVDFKKNIFGEDCSSRSDMRCFDKFLNPSLRSNFTIPKSVQFLMSSANSFTVKRPLRKQPRNASMSSKAKRARLGVVYDTPPKNPGEEDNLNNSTDTSEECVNILSDLGQTLDATSVDEHSDLETPLISDVEHHQNGGEILSDITDKECQNPHCDRNAANLEIAVGESSDSDLKSATPDRHLSPSSSSSADGREDDMINGRPQLTARDLCQIIKLTIPRKDFGPYS